MVLLDPHDIELPRKILIGKGVVERLSDVAKSLGLTGKAFVLLSKTSHKLVGEVALNSLSEGGFDVFDESVGASVEEQGEVIERANNVKPDFIVSIGGGTIIDLGKYAAFKLGVAFISVPTVASHDGISSPMVALKSLGVPYSIKTKPPTAIIADVNTIMRAPHRFLASGCGDVIAKLTAVRDWLLAHKIKNEYYGEYAASLALLSAKLIMRHARLIGAHKEDGVRVVIEALVSCGVAMCIAGSSRPCSGAEHQFSHMLDIIAPKPALHGEQCGVGTIMMAYLHGMDWRSIKKALKIIGAPTTAEELGIEDEYIIRALVEAHKVRPRYTILGDTGLTWEAAERVAKITKVIR
ncbi:MAG: NAD(P)-dependent glycerol-1-phosphate dehydrogenase [Nitrososphaerota archaeon]|nr:NAD(P)-dependent glycerol-1-phosphate dehydrogenase [Candidatus Nezhaarchaeota archaeon]MDW8049911.1 NAD(P)-dependent glycerol-1-phosphate dehydrogenase [Nitrososphaerota archaeon]